MTQPCAGELICNAGGTACLTGCGTSSPAGDADCVAGFYCDGVGAGACQPQETTGMTCSRNGQCASGDCVAGVCM